MEDYFKTKQGMNINKKEIAATYKDGYRNVFQPDGKPDRIDYNFIIVLKSGKELLLESDYHMEDIKRIEESMSDFHDLS